MIHGEGTGGIKRPAAISTACGRRSVLAGAAAWIALRPGGARGGAPARDLEPEPGGRVRALGRDASLILEDGRRVRLCALRLPDPADLPEGATAAETARVTAYAEAARAWLAARAVGASVALWSPEVARDRHGRGLAQVRVGGSDGPWLQAGLLAAGLARVATMPGAAAGAPALLSVEAAARRAGRGLWRDPLYRPRAPGATWPWLGTFQIVRGTVRDAAKVRGRIYLNYGDDWRRDFTVRIDRPSRIGFRVADLLELRRQFIQVRGWLFATNGPMILLDHPAALETRVTLG
ncbi:thermonuclease family protein [Roseospira navarrensis]|nr:thermonuclease family protein [Roseospira navarrensis]